MAAATLARPEPLFDGISYCCTKALQAHSAGQNVSNTGNGEKDRERLNRYMYLRMGTGQRVRLMKGETK